MKKLYLRSLEEGMGRMIDIHMTLSNSIPNFVKKLASKDINGQVYSTKK